MQLTDSMIHWSPASRSPVVSSWVGQLIYGLHSTSFGDCLIAKTAIGICQLEFFDSLIATDAEQKLQATWPNAEIRYQPAATAAIAQQILHHEIADPELFRLHVHGTPFQQQVWRSLLQIPRGVTTTYQALAIAIGHPNAARAVGNAVGKNPIAYLIPCHRVVRQSGELGGYRWGQDRKQQLLNWETQIR
ncbi:methylated-DNA--[protein]-cysteine S-methyltransferase [Synechococcus elongatus IITB4]|uniref:methylated-DNA--[protein]-cysteine S-methyltransferase n=1 Tax=Synechococcus elongatus TaxID=32046 RepID=UPI0030CDCC8A